MLNRYLRSGETGELKTHGTDDEDLYQIDFYNMDRSSARLSDHSTTSSFTHPPYNRAITARPVRAVGGNTRTRRVNSSVGAGNADSRKLPILTKRKSFECTPRSTGSEGTEAFDSSRTGSETNSSAVPPNGTRQAWSVFAEHIKCIDVNTMQFREKKLTPKSSYDFREVLTNMRHENEKQERKKNFARAINLTVQRRHHDNATGTHSPSISIDTHPAKEVPPTVSVETVSPGDNKEVDASSDNEATEDEVGSGKELPLPRGWSIMRRGVHEQVLEHRKAHTVVGWNLLQHTIDQMTDAERARQTLYERYLYDPDPNSWAAGLVNYPKFLRDRKQRDVAGRKRPFSSAPTAGRPRSRMTNAVSRSGKAASRATKKPQDVRPRSTQSLPNRPRDTNSSLSLR